MRWRRLPEPSTIGGEGSALEGAVPGQKAFLPGSHVGLPLGRAGFGEVIVHLENQSLEGSGGSTRPGAKSRSVPVPQWLCVLRQLAQALWVALISRGHSGLAFLDSASMAPWGVLELCRSGEAEGGCWAHDPGRT